MGFIIISDKVSTVDYCRVNNMMCVALCAKIYLLFLQCWPRMLRGHSGSHLG